MGDAVPWIVSATYDPFEYVTYIGPADPWTDGQGYVAGDLVEADAVVYQCVAAHVAEPDNAPPDEDFWEVYAGEHYIALVQNIGREPPINPAYWLRIGPHRGIWNRGDTYAPGDVVLDPQLGRIIVDGVTRARLVVLQAGHQYARVTEDGLESAGSGPVEILWRQGGIGEQWAVVRLCCGTGLKPPKRIGDAEMYLPTFECAGIATFIFRPGGELVTGAMLLDGAGTHSYPARMGNGTLALGPLVLGGYGLVYDPPPSGRLYLGAMECAGAGVRTNPPVGSGAIALAAPQLVGFGFTSQPVRNGSGSLALAAISITSSGGGYTSTAMFVAKMTNPIFDPATGRWVYDWIEQTIEPANGDYQDLAGGKSGNTSAGPFMRERNNTLVAVPVFSLARLRGAWNSQPLYDFEHCCSKGAAAAGGSLVLGAMICEGDGLVMPPPPVDGDCDLVLSAMVCAGSGYSNAYSVHVGTGNPQLGPTVVAGIGLSSTYSVHVGVGKPVHGGMVLAGVGNVEAPQFAGIGTGQTGEMTCAGFGLASEFSVNVGNGITQQAPMTCAGSGTVLAPVYSGNADLQLASMDVGGKGLSSAESVHVGVGPIQLGVMLCAGNGQFLPIKLGVGNLSLPALVCMGLAEAWIDTLDSSEGGIAAGGSHQVLADLGTDGGVSAGGSHQVLSDLGTDGGVAPGGSHQVLADLGTDGGVATGGND